MWYDEKEIIYKQRVNELEDSELDMNTTTMDDLDICVGKPVKCGTIQVADGGHGVVYRFGEDEEGRHTFDIPVEALDKPIPCAGWSIKKEQWYDRDITFLSSTLPDGAVTKRSDGTKWLIPAAAAVAGVAVIAGAAAIVSKRKKKAGGKA